MKIIHHCLVTKFSKIDDNGQKVLIEEFRGIDLVELRSEPYQSEMKCNNDERGWTFDIRWEDKDSNYYKEQIAYGEYLDSEYANDTKAAKSNKKKLVEFEERYRIEKEAYNLRKFCCVLLPRDENGNAYSEEHVRSIYNQVVEIKKLYEK